MSKKFSEFTVGGAVGGTDQLVGLAGTVNTIWTALQLGTYVLSLLDSDLTALASNTTNGLWARTGAGTGAARSIVGTANEITITNGDGGSGNPTASLPPAMTLTGKTMTGGTFTAVNRLDSTGRIASGGTIYVVADASNPTNSVGGEFAWLGATTRLMSYNRATSTAQPLQLSASALTVNISSTDIVSVTSTGAAVTGTLSATSWIKSGSFTVGTVPSASAAGAGAQIYVSNESGGAVTAFSDATNWRRVTDRAIIS